MDSRLCPSASRQKDIPCKLHGAKDCGYDERRYIYIKAFVLPPGGARAAFSSTVLSVNTLDPSPTVTVTGSSRALYPVQFVTCQFYLDQRPAWSSYRMSVNRAHCETTVRYSTVLNRDWLL